MTDHVLAARHEGEIVGGTINEVFEPDAESDTSVSSTWIFTKTPPFVGFMRARPSSKSTLEYLEDRGL
ncbi:MAG: hypothetical protein U5K37_03760 [Natrialbaceae archaeon]|nr:hypothetical protein [Natrialbaceae archaeon]